MNEELKTLLQRELDKVADTLEHSAGADIWHDPETYRNKFNNTETDEMVRKIEETQRAMCTAAAILRGMFRENNDG